MTTPTDPRVTAITRWIETHHPSSLLMETDVARVLDAITGLGWGIHNLPAPDLTGVSPGRTRNPDHETSKAGARDVAYRAGSQKHLLLTRYAEAGWDGLTDQEAGEAAYLSDACYWKRCGELRAADLIAPTGRVRAGHAGTPRIVCAITDTGAAVLRRLTRVAA